MPRQTLEKLIDKNKRRIDGRALDELKPVKIQVGVLENANGSAYIEQGKTKIMAAVYGPKEAHPRHIALPDRALLRCRYHMAPFSVEERKSPAPSRREHEISKVIRDALEPSILTADFPRTSIDVYLEVIQADGGTRCAGVTVASVALADAGIPLRDLVAGCASGKVDGHIVLDLNDVEDKKGDADIPLAYMPNKNGITLLQMNGLMTTREFEQAIELAIQGCKQIYNFQKNSLHNKYVPQAEEAEEEK